MKAKTILKLTEKERDTLEDAMEILNDISSYTPGYEIEDIFPYFLQNWGYSLKHIDVITIGNTDIEVE